MERTRIKELLSANTSPGSVSISGWVRTRRDAKGFSFMEVNDGSCLDSIQVIAEPQTAGFENIKEITTGASVSVAGELVASPGKKQDWEIRSERIDLIGAAPDTYPLQKKRHTDEFLRTIAHLRPRTNKYGAMLRIRSESTFLIHDFFRSRGFVHIHTPILTGSDCEGAGELFQATAIDLKSLSARDVPIDFSQDLFEKPAYLTVSGQLEAELLALALGSVYTFGPTFRAENSNTRRHMAEFWMVEPEMAFCDLKEAMDSAETLVKNIISRVMENCAADIGLFSRFVDKTLCQNLENINNSEFIRIPYRDALDILTKAEKNFDYPVRFGSDLQTEHERFLAETHFQKPLIIHDYPRSIKPFYMRVNDDGETVAAMDVIVPGIGEIIGGSQREERLYVLEERMAETGIDSSAYWWYLDSRRYGSCVHSGYGLGFERMMMLLTGISNIRDVTAFPRTPGNLDF